MEKEEERIRTVYDARQSDAVVYSVFNPGHLFMAQQLEREVVGMLQRHKMNPLRNRRILDVGCCAGGHLRDFVKYGALPENLSGIDLLPNGISEARRISPNMDLRCGNAEVLSFDSGIFDMVVQFTVFTSILNNEMKRKVAAEMLRVLKPDGVILWYDYFISKPTNRDVKAVGRKEISTLFPNCTFDFNKVTLAPPIARAIAPYSFFLCYLLEKIPWLRTHYLVVIAKG